MAEIITRFTGANDKKFAHSGEIVVSDNKELLQLAGVTDISEIEDIFDMPKVEGSFIWEANCMDGDFLVINYTPVEFKLSVKGEYSYETSLGEDQMGKVDYSYTVPADNILLTFKSDGFEDEEGSIEFNGGLAELYVSDGEAFLEIVINNL